MIKLVDIHHKDYDSVLNYAINNNYSPFSDIYVVQFDNDNKIIGILGIQMVCKFEPLLVDDNNVLIAKALYDTAIGVVLTKEQINRIEISVPNVENEQINRLVKLYEKIGFKFIEKAQRFVKILKDY